MLIGFVLALAIGAYVAFTGPAFDDFRQARKRLQEFPKARTHYLPSGACKQAPG